MEKNLSFIVKDCEVSENGVKMGKLERKCGENCILACVVVLLKVRGEHECVRGRIFWGSES